MTYYSRWLQPAIIQKDDASGFLTPDVSVPLFLGECEDLAADEDTANGWKLGRPDIPPTSPSPSGRGGRGEGKSGEGQKIPIPPNIFKNARYLNQQGIWGAFLE